MRQQLPLHASRSFASLINNASAIGEFVETVKPTDCSGEMSGLCPEDVLTGVAVSPRGASGRMAVLSLYTPLSAVTSEFSSKSQRRARARVCAHVR